MYDPVLSQTSQCTAWLRVQTVSVKASCTENIKEALLYCEAARPPGRLRLSSKSIEQLRAIQLTEEVCSKYKKQQM